MFNKISIIGCGLIGSSILRAVVEKKLASKISAYDKSSKATDYLKKNFSIEVCNNISNVVKDSDLVIIASPLSSYKEILLSIQSNLKENVILDSIEILKNGVKDGSLHPKKVKEAQDKLAPQFELLALSPKALNYDTRKGDIAREDVVAEAMTYLPGIIKRYNKNQKKVKMQLL